MAVRIGVDSGGTFTDVCGFDEVSGEFRIGKVSSTPLDPSVGIANGVDEILRTIGRSADEVGFLGHGTTVGTNALIQLKGPSTALITTEGFRDLLEIGRQKRPSLYDLQADKPVLLVPRDQRMEVPERLKHDGSVLEALDLERLKDVVNSIKESGAKAVAVCFLYSFINSEHEVAVKELLARELPDVFVSISSDVAPEFREYERMSTVVVNAYLGPTMKTYIDRLRVRLSDLGVKISPKLTQSNGGVISFEAASNYPVRTVLSGPSTGVVSAQRIAQMINLDDIITFDMGGTSSDVSLMKNGVCNLRGHAMVHGYPLKVPMLDIHTVGAGGGSIAYVDEGGLMKVGPESAGAFPGPVCYGNGNTDPTVTDANVVLQILSPEGFLDGKLQLHRDKSVAAIEVLANKLGIGVMEAAQGIISVATVNMAKAIRVVSTQKGYDPREYAMMAFGGAGPLHAVRLARELDIKKVIVPPYPGVLCAMGLLLTDLRTDFMVTRIASLADCELGELQRLFRGLLQEADAWFVQENIQHEDQSTELIVDMRYAGQNYELPVPVANNRLDDEALAHLKLSFLEAHQQQYGFSVDEPIQLVTYRVVAIGKAKQIRLPEYAVEGKSAEAALTGKRDIWYLETKDWQSTPIYNRSLLKAGNRLAGPAVIEQMDTTTFILPGMEVKVDPFLNLIIEDTGNRHAAT